MCQDAVDIVFRTHLDVFCWAFLSALPARVKPIVERLQLGARVVRAKPPPESNRIPRNAAVLLRLPLGSDDEFVVKVAWEGLEEAESTGEPVSRVFHDAGRAAKGAQGTAAEDGSEAGTRTAVWGAFVIIFWFGGGSRILSC